MALGDSLASGIEGQPSYVDYYARLLRRDANRRVRLTNLGRPGWTSTHLLDALRSDDSVRDAVASADVVTWDIGGNDILQAAFASVTRRCEEPIACLSDARVRFSGNWEAIVDELASLRRGRSTQLLTFDLYTPFVAVPGVARAEALHELAAMNATIRSTQGRHGIEVVPVAGAFRAAKGNSLIAGDGVHPTAKGHEVIARLLAAATDAPREVVPTG